MSYDTGFSRRSGSERDLQPVAIVAVDPTTRTATAVTRTRHTLYVNCAYATGDTITTPAVGEQWFVERFSGEWRLYGRIPFNDETLNIKPEEGQVSVGSAKGPLELNGTEVRINGETVRINGVYYRDNGETLQRSEDRITWETVLSAVEGDGSSIQLISEALTNFTGTDQQDALQALTDWAGTVQTLVDQTPDAWGEACQNSFIDGLRRMGTGDTDVAKVFNGGQNFIDYLFGTLFCDFDGNLTPQTVLSRTRDLAVPLSKRPIIRKFVQVAEKNGEGDNFLEKVFYGFESLFGLQNNRPARRSFGNLLIDPGAEIEELWTAQSSVVEWVGDLPERPDPDDPEGPPLPADPTRHGAGQLKIVDGGADKTFWWTIDDLGEPEWIDTKQGEIYYAEAWVRSPVRNGGTNSTAHLILQLRNSKTGATDTKYVAKTINQDENWRLPNRISGTFTVPGPTMLRPRYRTEPGVEWDQIRFGFTLITSQAWDDDVFFIDDMVVKEITGIQRILKNIHEPIFGDSIEYPTYEDLFKGIWNLRLRQRANLLADPHIRKPAYWANIPGVEVVQASLANRTRSGFRSLEMTSAGTTEVTFDWMRDENSVVWPILTEAEDIFYCECWVYAPLGNDPDSVVTMTGTAVDTTSEDPNNPGVYLKTVEVLPQKYKFNSRRGSWRRFSGYFIMPEANNTEGQEAIYDGFLAGIALKSGETQIGDTFFVDDLLVREATAEEMYQSPQRIFGNILLDPGAEFSHLWDDQSDVVEWVAGTETDPARRGSGQLKIVNNTTGQITIPSDDGDEVGKLFWWTVDELGNPEWVDTKEGEIFYAECFVRSPTRNGGVSSTVHLVLQLGNSKTGATEYKYVTKVINQDNSWRLTNKISGHFTVPGPNLLRPRYRTTLGAEWDQIRFGFMLVEDQDWPDDEFFIDDMVVRELTGVQRILKSIHEPIFGDSIEYPTYEDVFKGIWNLRRRLGPNLLGDPHVRKDEYWAGLTNVEVVGPGLENRNRSGTKSLKMTSAGTTEVTFDWMRDENSVVFPILTEAQNVFYCECWVYAPWANDPDSVLSLLGTAVDTTSEDTEHPGTFTKTVDLVPQRLKSNSRRGGWRKFSAYFVVPEPNNTEGQEAIYDGFLAGIALKSGETALGDVFFVDDLLVREVTAEDLYQSPQRLLGNLLLDPNAEYSNLWDDQSDVVEWVEDSETDPAHRGNGQLKIVSAGATDKTFWWTIDDLGEPEWLDTQEGEIFYAEAWVRSPVRNDGVSSTAQLVLELRNSLTGATDLKYVTKVINQDDDWRLSNRISGTFTVPGPNLLRPRYQTEPGVEWNQVRFGFGLIGGQTYEGDEFFIDNMVVKEITGLQKILKGIHEPIFGDSIEYPTYEDIQRGISRLLHRSLGPNLLGDPRFTKENYWTGLPSSVSYVTKSLVDKTRSGLRSLKISSTGAAVSFDWMRDESAVIWPILTEAGDIFYCECWVYAPLGNDPDSIVTIHGRAVDTTSEDPENPGVYLKTVEITPIISDTLTRGFWHKVSGYYTIPEPDNTDGQEAIYDGFIAGTTLGAGETTAGDVFFVDDLEVREVSDVQNLTDGIFQGIFGGDGRWNNPDAVRGGLLGLAALGRGRNKVGSNILPDPKVTDLVFWSSPGLSLVNSPRRSMTQSLELLSDGAVERSLDFMRNDTGEGIPVTAQEGDVFYCECWVRASTDNNDTTATIKLFGRATNSSTGATADLTTAAMTLTNPVRGIWRKISGLYTIPVDTAVADDSSSYDQFNVGLSVTTAAGTNYKFNIDDMVVREITVASEAKTLASGANTLANKAAELARRKQRAGTNLVLDSKVSMAAPDSYWLKTGNANLSIFTGGALALPSNTFKRSGTQSLAVTLPGTTGTTNTSFALTLDDDGATIPLIAQGDDTFYAEAWIKTGTSATVSLIGKWANSDTLATRPAALATYSKALTSADNWHKLSGTFTIPPDADADTGTYDSLIVELKVEGTATRVVYVDDMLVRENTAAQNTIDNIHQGIFGGAATGKTPGEVKGLFQNLNQALFRNNALPSAASSTGLGIHVNALPDNVGRNKIPDLKDTIDNIHNAITGGAGTDNAPNLLGTVFPRMVSLSRNRQRAGSNLVNDPKIIEATATSSWATYATKSSLPLTIVTTPRRSGTQSLQVSATTFSITINDLGDVTPLAAQNNDIFYVEAWVAGTGTATLTGLWVKSSVPSTGQTLTGAVPAGGSLSASPTGTAAGNWVKISGYYTIPAAASSDYDSFNARITTTGTIYVDDMAIREVTEAQAAAGTANTAKDGNQNFINRLHEALNGGTATSQTPENVKGLFQNLNQALFRNNSAPASGTSASIDQAAIPTLGSGVARTKFQDLRETIDNIHNAITGGSTSSNLPSVLDTGMKALVGLGRGRNKAGSNMVLDSKIINTTLWSNYATLQSLTASLATNTTTPVLATGNQNLMITIPAGGSVSFDWLLDDQGKAAPVAVEDNDVIHVECMVYGAAASTVTLTYKQVVSISGGVSGATTIATATFGSADYPLSTWKRLVGKFTVPVHTTYDSIQVGMTVTGTSGQKVYVDDLVVRENTVAQNIIDGIQQAGVGGTGGSATLNSPTTVKTGILGLFNLGRGQTGSGSNLLADPKALVAGFWTAATTVGTLAISTTYRRSNVGSSLRLTPASGSAKFDFTVNDTGVLQPIITQEGDTFYVECWVVTPTTFTGTVTLHGEVFNLATPTSRVTATAVESNNGGGALVLTNPTASGTWKKLSGYFTIPGTTYDGFTAGITVVGTADIYVDDMLVRETTVGNHLTQALSGKAVPTNQPLKEVFDKLKETFDTISGHTTKLNELASAKEATASGGSSVNIDFSNYGSGDLFQVKKPDGANAFTVTYPTDGGARLGISGGLAGWTSNGTGNTYGQIVYTNDTLSDFQSIKGTMSEVPDPAPIGNSSSTAPRFYALARVGTGTATNNCYVWARAYAVNIAVYRGEIGCTVNGVETLWADNIVLPWSTSMTLNVGVGTDSRQYQVYSGGALVWQHTEVLGGATSNFPKNYTTLQSSSGLMSRLCSLSHNYSANHTDACVKYRKWGALAQLRHYGGIVRNSGRIGATSVADNLPATKNGSTARMWKLSDTTITWGVGETVLGPGFFDQISGTGGYESLDIDANTVTNSFKVTQAKAYVISARVELDGTVTGAWGGLNLQVSTDGGANWSTRQRGNTSSLAVGGSGLTGSWVQYLEAGEMARIVIERSGGSSSETFNGDGSGTTGSRSYFSIAAAG